MGSREGGKGGAGLLRSSLIEHLVHKMDDLPQGAIRPGSSWKKEKGKGGVGKRKGVGERQDPKTDKCQNKADKPGSRERDGVGRWWKSVPRIANSRHTRGQRQLAVISERLLCLCSAFGLSMSDNACGSSFRFRVLSPLLEGNVLSCCHCFAPQCK